MMKVHKRTQKITTWRHGERNLYTKMNKRNRTQKKNDENENKCRFETKKETDYSNNSFLKCVEQI